MDNTAFSHSNRKYFEGPTATERHTVDVWLPNTANGHASVKRKWVIYIHGGGWRDPEQESLTFLPAVKLLQTSDAPIAGFASINYRLSPYSYHSRLPSSPDDPSRNARHPDHVNDVSRALAFLENEYGISTGYLLVGHSCGATLAFQLQEQCGDLKVPKPLCIVGSEGIYDFSEIVESHESPVYRDFVTSAFGPDEGTWTVNSPFSSQLPTMWQTVKLIIISHSDEDELVGEVQAELMLERIHRTSNCQSRFIPAIGKHDETWGEGHELARIIVEALEAIEPPPEV